MEIEEVSDSGEIGLFREKFYTDWVAILGLAGAAIGAFSATRGYENARDFVASDWVALAIDASIGAGINLLIFGFVPAIFRRRSLRASGAKSKPGEFMPTWKFLLLVLAICPIVVIVSANGNDSQLGTGASMNRCMPKGADELCVEAEYLGGERISLKSTWKYSSIQSLAGYSVSRISWVTQIDCEPRSGSVNALYVYDEIGEQIPLAFDIRDQVIEGIESDQLSQIVAQACAEN